MSLSQVNDVPNKTIPIELPLHPSEPAKSRKFKLFDRKIGNDGNLWMIKREKGNGKKYWEKIIDYKIFDFKSPTNTRSSFPSKTNSYVMVDDITNKKYYTHDNGARPFLVDINNKEINVFTFETNSHDELKDSDYKVKVLTIKNFIGYWKGHDPNYDEYEGNSLLIQFGSYDYVCICQEIYAFKTNDIIYDYCSEVGNSDVPYPIALGEQNTYFMLDHDYLKNDTIPIQLGFSNLYGYYYGHLSVINNKIQNTENNKKTKPPMAFSLDMLNFDVLQKRL